jgi:hypothetical protein
VQFRWEHHTGRGLVSRILGWGDLRDDGRLRQFVRGHPFVAFPPAEAPAPDR